MSFQRLFRRDILELTLLPVALAVAVSISLAFSIKTICMLQLARWDLPIYTLGYLTPITIMAFWLSAKTRGIVRVAVLMQTAAIAVFAASSLLGLRPATFIDVLSAIICGGIGGALNTYLKAQKKTLQTQEFEINLRRKQLREAKLALVKHDEVERRLLAADLHDQVLHDLKMVRQTLNECRADLEPELLNSLQTDVSHCMSAVREVMDHLFPSSLEHLGLIGAIEECLDSAGRRAGFESFVRAKVTPEQLEELNRVETLLLFRLLQEAMNNISKHAHAKNVSCHISREVNDIVVRITDDGVGIKNANSDGRGLKYMKQRAELIGATIAWKANEQASGTIVEIRIARPVSLEKARERRKLASA